MDTSILAGHMEIIAKHYPNMKITQLGMVTLLLGSLRATMGHERAEGTLDNYIHVKHLSKDIRQCIDFIEREVLSLKKSRLDIDIWKRGNVANERRDEDKAETERGVD